MSLSTKPGSKTLSNPRTTQGKRSGLLRAVSLPARAGVMRDLANATKILVGLEREAFGIVPEVAKPSAAMAQSADELRAELARDLVELGVIPTPTSSNTNEENGVANRNGTAH